jgi:hypothetical protein
VELEAGAAAGMAGRKEGAGSLFFASFSLGRRSTWLPSLTLRSLTGGVRFGPTSLTCGAKEGIHFSNPFFSHSTKEIFEQNRYFLRFKIFVVIDFFLQF